MHTHILQIVDLLVKIHIQNGVSLRTSGCNPLPKQKELILCILVLVLLGVFSEISSSKWPTGNQFSKSVNAHTSKHTPFWGSHVFYSVPPHLRSENCRHNFGRQFLRASCGFARSISQRQENYHNSAIYWAHPGGEKLVYNARPVDPYCESQPLQVLQVTTWPGLDINLPAQFAWCIYIR